MNTQFGSFQGLTLEKKIELPQEKPNTQPTSTPPELDVGGSGGDIGKIIHHGGGDGGDDGSDDDDDYYFDDFDDGEKGGLFRRRMFLEEQCILCFHQLFDRKFVDAVLNEWQRTRMDLPVGFRQAYEMGLVSSAQMVRFLVINARPTTSRFISRVLPEGLSNAFIGRMIADPAFLNKLLLSRQAQLLRQCGGRIKQEWDLALINVVTAAVCNAAVVWSLSPCYSYRNTVQFDLQNALLKLPNNIFEKSYQFRQFDLQKRIQSFFFKVAELCMAGLPAGAVQGSVSNALSKKRNGRLSVTSVSTNALGYGAFLGLYSNMRYQLVCGFDRALVNHFDVIGVALFFSMALRVFNVQLGETSRRAWLGVEVDPLFESDHLLKVYNRPSSEDLDALSSKWFISKNSVVYGLGLLGIKQNTEPDAKSPAPKAQKKELLGRKLLQDQINFT